jgi:hypothetical protein
MPSIPAKLLRVLLAGRSDKFQAKLNRGENIAPGDVELYAATFLASIAITSRDKA